MPGDGINSTILMRSLSVPQATVRGYIPSKLRIAYFQSQSSLCPFKKHYILVERRRSVVLARESSMLRDGMFYEGKAGACSLKLSFGVDKKER